MATLLLPATAVADAPLDNSQPLVAIDAGAHTGWVTRLIVDRYQLISVSHDKTIRIWDLSGYEPQRVLRPPIGRGPVGQLYSASLSPDGKLLAVCGNTAPEGTQDHRVWVISLPEGELVQRLAGNSGPVHDVAFSPDGKWLAAVGDDKMLRLWSTEDWKLAATFAGHSTRIYALAWHPSSTRLVTASRDRSCRLWAMPKGTSQVLLGHTDTVRSVAWSHDGRTIASGGGDHRIMLWEADGRLRKQFFTASETVQTVSFSPDDKKLAYGCGSSRSLRSAVGLISAVDGHVLANYTPISDTPLCSAFTPDGKHLISGDTDEQICVWSTENNGRLERRLRSPGGDVIANGWSSAGRAIGYGYRGTPQQRLHATTPLDRSFSLEALDFGPKPDGGYWRAKTQWGDLSMERTRRHSTVNVNQNGYSILQYRMPGIPSVVRSRTLLPGNRAAVGGEQGLFIFDARTGHTIYTLPGHTDTVVSLAPSPDSRYLLTGSDDQTLEIWNLDRYEHVLSIFFAGDEWIAWTPQGYYAASLAGESLMGWHVQHGFDAMAEFFPASRFHDRFYRPDVIRGLLGAGGPLQALKAANQLYERDSKAIMIKASLPPRVKITSPAAATTPAGQAELKVEAVAQAAGDDQIRSLRLLVDGRPAQEIRIQRPAAQDAAGPKLIAPSVTAADDGPPLEPNLNTTDLQAASGHWSLKLTPGKHTLHVKADSSKSSGLSEPVEVELGSEKTSRPRLFVLALGVSTYEQTDMRRTYAAADAVALAAAIAQQSKTGFQEILVHKLTDAQVTHASLTEGFKWLQDNMRANDVALVLFAGYVARDSQDVLFLLPHEGRVAEPAKSGLSETVLKANLQQTAGRIVMLLDVAVKDAAAEKKGTGNAGPGSLFRRSPEDLLRDLAREDVGVAVIGATTGRDLPLDVPAGSHGAFGQAVLDGLGGQADGDSDGTIDVQELAQFVKTRVKESTAGKQRPVTAQPALVPVFPLSYR